MATKIAVIGAGHVGATCAYAIVHSGIATEVVLVDQDAARAEGEAMDIAHAVPFGRPVRVWAGTYASCVGSSIVVLAAGARQRPGQTRLDLLHTNDAVMRDIVPKALVAAPDAVLIVATNPVDVLTWRAQTLSGLPEGRVLGSGTILDTARFRYLLSERLRVDARNIHAFVVGEHGDSSVPVWSNANVAGVSLADFCARRGIPFDARERDEIFHATRDAASAIVARKGSTYYGIAAGLARICEAIVRDQRTVLTVSTLIDGPYGIRNTCLSLPTIVDSGGARSVLQLPLTEAEAAALGRSAGILQAARESLTP